MADLDLQDKELVGANVLRVTVGSTGLRGGDAGHGGRTHFALNGGGSTGWTCSVPTGGDGVTIDLSGDSELQTFTGALEFGFKTLRTKALFNSDLPESVTRQLEAVERDLNDLATGRWDRAKSKNGADQIREAASRVVLSAKHLESLVKGNTFPAV